MSKFPEWVIPHKRPGAEIKHINGHFYLYEVSSHWDSQKNRAQKRSGKIVGKITPEGIVESLRRGQPREAPRQPLPLPFDAGKIAVKEYGLTQFIEQRFKEHLTALQKHFPEHWRWVMVVAYCRLAHAAPIKRMPLHFAHSFLSETYGGLQVSDKNISLALRDIGRDRDACCAYMRSFVAKDDHIMVDMTGLTSKSELIPLAKKGYSPGVGIETQFNLLYLYSSSLQTPAFYRLVAGNLRESRAVKLLMGESGVKDCVFVADKGFYSKANAKFLTQLGLPYVIPLKRDSKLILPDWLQEGAFKKDGQYFDFDGRYVWAQEHETEAGQKLYLYLSEFLKAKEEHDYLGRISTLPEKFSLANFHKKRPSFGTLALVTSLKGKSAKEVYTTYKSRCDIENMFDHLKTQLEADRTYMQNEEALQGWMFANHVALQWYYMLYHQILKATKLKKCSVRDVLECLKEVRKIRIDSKWVLAEITSSVQKILASVQIHIT